MEFEDDQGRSRDPVGGFGVVGRSMWRWRKLQPTATATANLSTRIATTTTTTTASGWAGRATDFHVGCSDLDPRKCNRRDLSSGGY